MIQYYSPILTALQYVASLTSVALSDLGCMSEMDLPILTWIESVLAFRCHHATTHLTDHSGVRNTITLGLHSD